MLASTEEANDTLPASSDDIIDYGKSVIVRASDGSAKVVRLPKATRAVDIGNDGEHSPKGKKPRPKRLDNVKIGKTVVPITALVGRRYGSTIHYNEGDGWVRSQCSKVSTSEDAEIDTTVNNQFLEQKSEDNQPDLAASSSATDAALKSKTFEMKTQFSQEKYLRKKQKKYLREVTLLPLNIYNYCHYAPGAANGPRFDLVGSILRHSSQCNSLVIWDDSCGGLITAAALERGQHVERLARGRGTTPDAAITELGIPGETVGSLLSKTQLIDEEDDSKQDDDVGDDGLRHYHKRSRKRSVVGNPVISPDGGVVVWMDLAISGGTKEFFEVTSVVMEQITPYCGTLVVLVRHIDLVQRLQRELIKSDEWINVSLTEPIVREHQVLPNRTHPIMQSATNSAQGFLLTATKVVVSSKQATSKDIATPEKRMKVDTDGAGVSTNV